MALTKGFKKFVGLVGVVAVVGGGIFAYKQGYFGKHNSTDTGTVSQSVVPNVDDNLPTLGSPISKISANVGQADTSKPIAIQVQVWNANAGLAYANGGVTSTPDSLMAKHGANVKLVRVDDYKDMFTGLATFAKQLQAGNQNPTDGAPFMVIEGDALPGQIVRANAALAPYGQSAVGVAIIGFSRGEDKCMMPPQLRDNPNAARGMTVGGVPRDGDLHICFKWAKDNGIPVNPNGKTYDPNALNIKEVSDFMQSDNMYINGYTESRPVVVNGQLTGAKQVVHVDGTATYTPGDVKIATSKGGIVGIASTKEYSYQMPALIIGNKQWMEANQELTRNILAAAMEGSHAVMHDDNALLKAGEVQAAVYHEEDAQYWAKYFKGLTQPDVTGLPVNLGGSNASDLADNVFYFGLNGNDNIFKKVYAVYGTIDHTYYPEQIPTVLPYDQVVDTQYISTLANNTSNLQTVQAPSYVPNAKVTGVFSKAAWKIEFQSGRATFAPGTQATLNDLLNNLSETSMAIQIKGYTDNVGNDQSNIALSQQRANAVKAWLLANAPGTMTANRISAIGYGSQNPVADNTSADGRAQNRRVEILQVETQ
jgi:OOP family OmpA-OmpF porin